MDTSTTVRQSDLELQEAIASRPSALQNDDTVLIHVIRPTIGQGLGRHKYTAEMLRENAEVFQGWKMYIDHQSPEAKKAAGGLPRSIHDLGGRILESWWDESVPAEGRFGQGAVVAKVKPVGQVKKLIEEDPELLEASIRAKATNVHEAVENGEQVWVVEGINSAPPGSVDWVTEGGAGGRVANLIEGLMSEVEELETEEGDTTVKQLEEALNDPESEVSKRFRQAVAQRTQFALEKQAERHAEELAEAKSTELSEAVRAEIKAEVEAEHQRKIELRDMRDSAHSQIEEAKLPSKTAAKIKAEYELTDEVPSAKLDTDFDALKSSVEEDIREAKELLAEVAPTRVEGQGPSNVDGDGPTTPVAKPFFKEFLEEAGIDPEQAYGNTMKESV